MICPSCNQQNPKGARYCGECGMVLQVDASCPSCGFTNPCSNKFCSGCGQRLEHHPSQTPSRSRVMAVEDVPFFQEAIKDTLSVDPNIELVYMASSGEEALEAFPRASPDLVLLDFVLPGISGLETAKRMKEQRPYVKIAIVTAFLDDVLARVAEEADIVEVIPKSSFSVGRVQQLLID